MCRYGNISIYLSIACFLLACEDAASSASSLGDAAAGEADAVIGGMDERDAAMAKDSMSSGPDTDGHIGSDDDRGTNLMPEDAGAEPVRDMSISEVDAAVSTWEPSATSSTPVLTDTGPILELLLVGDNYIGFNQLCDKITSLASGSARWDGVVCEITSSGGFRLINHADVAANGSVTCDDQRGCPGTQVCEENLCEGGLAKYLDAQDPERSQFDLMILQERAQASGFPPGQTARAEFGQAVEELAIRATQLNTPTALLMTWGRDGDPNTGLYPNYEIMQQRIAEGHYAVVEQVGALGEMVSVIEVGEVWFRIHRRSEADFMSLFLSNDHHPSEIGSWLMAGVILSRVTGLEPADWPLVSGLPPAELWSRLKDDVINR